MKINVMSPTGQLGAKIMRSLLELVPAEDLIGSARKPDKAEEFAGLGIDIRHADYDDVESMIKAFAGTDILHLIPTLSPIEPRKVQHTDAIAAARAAGVKKVVFSSFASASPDSKFYVAPFMVFAEAVLRESGLDWTILRDGMYLDPIADWIPELVEMGRLPYPVKSGKVAYISRDDLARATAAALTGEGHSERIYELTGAEALSMERLAEIISGVTGRPVRFDSITDEEYAEICRTGREEVPEFIIPMLTTLYHAVDNGEFELVTDHVEMLTGRPPETAESYLRSALDL
jgi:NAD(P)H dehydrogenase (quinone)